VSGGSVHERRWAAAGGETGTQVGGWWGRGAPARCLALQQLLLTVHLGAGAWTVGRRHHFVWTDFGRRDVADCVSEGVSAQVAVASEDLSATGALVGFVVRVREQVRLEIRALVEGARAHRTLVRTLLHVQDLVHGQGARLAEPFAAFCALEWLLL
jgi:hypothetical protein